MLRSPVALFSLVMKDITQAEKAALEIIGN